MSCEAIQELLSAQLDDQLDAAETDALVAHLAGCADCQAQRERLQKTVRLLRGSGPLLPLGRGALTDLETELELTALDEVNQDGCEPFLEMQSAQLDGELAADETEALLAHLPRCSVCQAHRRRLQKLRQGLGPQPALVPVGEATFAALDRKLDAALAEELGSGVGAVADDEDDAHHDGVGGRILSFPPPAQLTRFAAAAAVLLLAGLIVWRGYGSLKEIAGWDRPEKVEPRIQGSYELPPSKTKTKQTPSPAPSSTDAPAPTPTGAPTPRPTAVVVTTESPSPAPTPAPSPTVVRSPAPTPTPAPSRSPGKTKVRDPKPTPTARPRPQIAVAQLKAILQRIRAGKDDPEVPALIASLGAAKFDHDLAYGFLQGVLRGKLDDYADPNACRRQAFGALGGLGTPRAVAALLAAPRRRLHRDRDDAALAQALRRLKGDAAIAALSQALLRTRRPLRVERRLIVVTALADLARPAGGPGLLGLLAAGGQPRELVREAARALGRSGHPEALKTLKAALREDRRTLVRQGSALGLGELAGRDLLAAVVQPAIDELERGLKDKQKLLVSEACVEGLRLSRSPRAVKPLIGCLKPSEERASIRRGAHLALCSLAGEEPAGVRTAAQWAKWFEKLPEGRRGRLGQPQVDRIDREGFRKNPGRSRGVVFVIDTSGSMKDKRDLMLFELEQALEKLPPRVRFQVLFFGDAPRALWPRRRLAPASVFNRRRALEAARQQKIVPVAQTVLKKTLRAALAYEDADAIYLISDGLVTSDDLTSLRPTVRRWNRSRERPARIDVVHLRRTGSAVRLMLGSPLPAETWPTMHFMHQLAAENDGDYAHN